jgi:hypothetical protein
LKAWLLVAVALSGSGVLLLLSGVRALIGKMLGLSTIIAYAGREFLKPAQEHVVTFARACSTQGACHDGRVADERDRFG